jgi:hypothetical protein
MDPISFAVSPNLLATYKLSSFKEFTISNTVVFAQASPSFSPCNAACQIPDSIDGAEAAIPYIAAGAALTAYALKRSNIFSRKQQNDKSE